MLLYLLGHTAGTRPADFPKLSDELYTRFVRSGRGGTSHKLRFSYLASSWRWPVFTALMEHFAQSGQVDIDERKIRSLRHRAEQESLDAATCRKLAGLFARYAGLMRRYGHAQLYVATGDWWTVPDNSSQAPGIVRDEQVLALLDQRQPPGTLYKTPRLRRIRGQAYESPYHASPEDLTIFSEFLRHSGGFEVR